VDFSKSDENDETIAKLTIENQTFEGQGSNKNQAKSEAYKKAVRFYDTENKITFF
jgi:hypothetical protein